MNLYDRPLQRRYEAQAWSMPVACSTSPAVEMPKTTLLFASLLFAGIGWKQLTLKNSSPQSYWKQYAGLVSCTSLAATGPQGKGIFQIASEDRKVEGSAPTQRILTAHGVSIYCNSKISPGSTN